MAELYFTFNGVTSLSMGLRVDDNFRRDILMPLKQVTQSVPGRDGDYLMKQDRGIRTYPVPVTLVGTSPEDAQAKVRLLAQWLIWPDPAALIFSDEPDKVYYAVLNGNSPLDRLILARQTTLEFVILDPYAYGTEHTNSLSLGNNTIVHDGNAVAYPHMAFALDNPASFIRISHVEQGKFVTVGTVDDVEQTTENPRTTQLLDGCGTITGVWEVNPSGHTVDNGIMAGLMATDGNKFSPLIAGGGFGSGSTWHGPLLHRHLANPATDFEVTVKFGFDCRTGKTGRIELYLLDDTGTHIGKLEMVDSSTSAVRSQFVGCAGTGTGAYNALKTSPYWTNMVTNMGIMTVKRVGKLWSWTIGSYNAAKKIMTSRWSWSWTDATGAFDADLDSVDLHIAKYGSGSNIATLWVTTIQVDEINTPSSDTAPQNIFEAGVDIDINMATGSVSYDGQPYMKHLDITSQFFGYDPGNNTIEVATVDGVGLTSATSTHTDRWL